MLSHLKRVILIMFAGGGLVLLAFLLYAGADMRAFEWEPLFQLLGWKGLAFIFLLIGGLIVAVYQALRAGLGGSHVSSLPLKLLLGAWVLAVLWLVEWTFMEEPLTVRVANGLMLEGNKAAAVASAVARARRSGDRDALRSFAPSLDEEQVAVMLARISANRPSAFDAVPIGSTIARYAERYEIDPIVLLSMLYVGSFYGEATSGRMPFFEGITPETFRDLVQAHLPWWFVESGLRSALVEHTYLQRVFGEWAGGKLRYALHKATYDISVDPFETNTFSDLFLVMREFRREFSNLLDPNRPGDSLARTFLALESLALLKPYEAPYLHPARDGKYYGEHRDELISFSRAALYQLVLDFEFATKAHALLIRYYGDRFAERLGRQTWEQLSRGQRAALIMMLRDLYVPNIGRLGYNAYLLPELNCTAVEFVAREASEDTGDLSNGKVLWRPREYWKVWAGAEYKLRALSEVWRAMTGEGLPGIRPTATIPEAVQVLARMGGQ